MHPILKYEFPHQASLCLTEAYLNYENQLSNHHKVIIIFFHRELAGLNDHTENALELQQKA